MIGTFVHLKYDGNECVSTLWKCHIVTERFINIYVGVSGMRIYHFFYKISFIRASVESILLHGVESWALTKKLSNRPEKTCRRVCTELYPVCR